MRQADRDDGRRADGLTTEEREEVRRLRREVQGVARGAGDTGKSSGLVRQGDQFDPVRGFEFVRAHQAAYPRGHDVPGAGGLRQRVLRVAVPAAVRARQADAAFFERIRVIHGRFQRHVWGAPHPCRAGARRGCTSAASGSRDCCRRRAWRGVSRRLRDDTIRRIAHARPAQDLVERSFVVDGPESVVGGRHHLHSDLGGLPVCGRGPGGVESPRRRLGDGQSPQE